MNNFSKAQNKKTNLPFIRHSVLSLALITGSTFAATQQEYYVSPTGDDANSGTLASPFASIEKARDQVRTINDSMTGDIYVYLRGGNYEISNTIELTEEDSGSNDYRVYYEAYNGEEPVINGATLVSGWTQHSGNIYKATLNRTEKLRTLIVNDERAYMASKDVSPNGNWGSYDITAGQASWARISGSEADGVTYDLSDISTLTNASDVEIMNKTTWNTNIITVRESVVENSERVLKFSQPYAAIAQNQQWGAFSNSGTHTLSNAYEFLDENNEFYFDRGTKTLYYYSDSINISTAEVYAPKTGVLLNLTGDSPSNRIKNVSFTGITFANTESVLPEVDGSAGKSTVQAATWKTAYSDANWHNDKYTGYDVLSGAINVNHAESIHFNNGKIKHAGNEGINFTNDVIDSQIVGNAIIDMGGSGINIAHPQHVYIGDGGEYEKYPATHEGLVQNISIRNNLIYDVTQLYFGHAAITAFFVNGLEIEYNQIQNAKYSGVSLGWGWNNFAEETIPENPTTVAGNNKFNYNRVYNVMTYLHDGGAFYTLGSQPNSEASYNYVKAPTTYFQGVYHPDEGSAWYTGTDLVFEIVPGQDNFELNTWRDKHDNHYDNIFSTSSAYQIGAPNSTITNLQVYPDANWPQEALNIIDAAGLQTGYQHLLDGIPEPPEVPGLSDPSAGTILEAEDATILGAGNIFTDEEASEGSSVENIHRNNAGIEFTDVPKSTSLVVTYTSKKTGTYSVYVDNVHKADISFTSTNAWAGSYTTTEQVYIDIPEGSTLKLQKDSSDTGINIDFISLLDQSLSKEAEDASLYGSASVGNSHSGHSGSGFAENMVNESSAVQFNVNTIESGEYFLDLRYAMGTYGPSGARSLSLYINDEYDQVTDFITTGDWAVWSNTRNAVSLLPGNNTIKYEFDSNASGFVNLDFIQLLKIYEAEDAVLTGISSNNNHSGFNGFGFVENVINIDDAAEFTVTVPVGGQYTVTMRYAMGSDGPSSNRTLSVYVNGTDTVQSSFTSTGAWNAWNEQAVSVTLQAGSNTIKYQYDADDTGWINLDYITVN